MMISRITKSAAALSAFALMSSAAYAGCGNALYCNSGSHGHAASTASYGSSTVNMPGTYGSSSYSGTVNMPGTYSSSYSSSYGGSMSDSQADAVYGSGSISGAYVDSSSVGSTYRSATVSNMTIPGLGMNERLVPTSCDVNVHGAAGARVLGCYNVAQPVQVYTPPPMQVRVVRPIVYVRYPVPVPVAMPACGSTWSARYLGHGSRCGR